MFNNSEITFGQLTSVPDGKIIEKIYNYVYSILLKFKGTPKDNENHLTNSLCIQLQCNNTKQVNPFFFHHQYIENSKENTSSDFAVFGNVLCAQHTGQDGDRFPLVTFEAKRLTNSIGKSRKKEYVIGEYKDSKQIKNSGGIERFKNLRHGKSVYYTGIIGYVQSNTFEHWTREINSWISEEIENPNDSSLIWDKDDYLTPLHKVNETIITFESNPKRQNKKSLYMRHLWVNLTS